MKEKAVIFGAGSKAKMSIKELLEKYEIVAFLDNDPSVWGGKLAGVTIHNPQDIKEMQFDKIVFCNTGLSATEAWLEQIEQMGFSDRSIVDFSFCIYGKDARNEFLKDFAVFARRHDLAGAVAEAGVSTGEYSKIINLCFPERKLHLFDSFEGFSNIDLISDETDETEGRYSNTDEKTVLEKMKYPENAVIHKGWFPESAKSLQDEMFCFVCLDLDLYEPILAGLKLFSGRMVNKGVILVHDDFNDHYPGARRAVDEFICSHPKVHCAPIGDNMSVILMGFE